MESLKPPTHILEASKAFVFVGTNTQVESIQMIISDFIMQNRIADNKDYPNQFSFRCLDSCRDFYITSCFADYIKSSYNDGMIEGYLTILDFWKGKRQSMRAGKFVKKLFPYATDSQVESVVAELKAMFTPLEFELIVCGKPETFHNVYMTPHIPRQSPRFDNGKLYYVKRLDCSCMRWEHFEGWKQHPATVYGAGDLQLAYVKDKTSGKIAARVIIYPENLSCSDIYSANDKATELLVNYLKDNGYKPNGISGARLSKIQKSGEYYLMPYVDGEDSVEDCGEYFIAGKGRIRCNSTDGKIYLEEMLYCDDCGEDYTESNVTFIDGNCVCNYCRSENYSYSRLMDQYIRDSDCETSGDGDIATSDYFSQSGYVLDYKGVWQEESECVEYDGEYYHHDSHCVTYFDGKYYHEDSEELREAQEKKESQDQAYKVNVTYQFGWKTIPERNATPFLAMLETTERVLRDNYQLNENGIPERLPELDFT